MLSGVDDEMSATVFGPDSGTVRSVGSRRSYCTRITFGSGGSPSSDHGLPG